MISRRIGERIVLGDNTEIVVTEIHRRTVRLGVKAAPGVPVMRGEVWDAVEAENRRAAENAWTVDDGQPEDGEGVTKEKPVAILPSPRSRSQNEKTRSP